MITANKRLIAAGIAELRLQVLIMRVQIRQTPARVNVSVGDLKEKVSSSRNAFERTRGPSLDDPLDDGDP